jgi:hypothetical protein
LHATLQLSLFSSTAQESPTPGISTSQQQPSQLSAVSAQATPLRDGAHDFDFLIGKWKAHVRRLPDRLVVPEAYRGLQILDISRRQFEDISIEVWCFENRPGFGFYARSVEEMPVQGIVSPAAGRLSGTVFCCHILYDGSAA